MEIKLDPKCDYKWIYWGFIPKYIDLTWAQAERTKATQNRIERKMETNFNRSAMLYFFFGFIFTNIDLTCAQAEQIKTKHFGMTIKWKSTSTDIRFYTKFMWFYT